MFDTEVSQLEVPRQKVKSLREICPTSDAPQLHDIPDGMTFGAKLNLRRENREIVQESLKEKWREACCLSSNVRVLSPCDYPWVVCAIAHHSQDGILLLALSDSKSGNTVIGAVQTANQRGNRQEVSMEELPQLVAVRNYLIQQYGSKLRIN